MTSRRYGSILIVSVSFLVGFPLVCRRRIMEELLLLITESLQSLAMLRLGWSTKTGTSLKSYTYRLLILIMRKLKLNIVVNRYFSRSTGSILLM